MRRRLILPLVALAVAATLVAPTGAAAQTTFTFYGSGYGHGIGMSQWGAFGLAKAGWTAHDILRHYYTDTEVEGFDLGEPLRVGLASGRTSLRILAISGDLPLAVGDATVATVPAGQTWTILSSGVAGFEIRDASGAVIAGPIGAPGTPLVADLGAARAKIVETSRTYARGSLEFGLHLCGRTCSVRLVLVADVEEYLYGLGEVPSSWPAAALETQAIAARTYAVNKATISQHRSPCDCAVVATTYDQVYIGYDKEIGTNGSRWVAAVDATAGEVVTYGGTPIQAYYMSSSGGHTESNDAVWGGTPLPYLRAVCDPGDYVPGNPSATWVVTRSASDVTAQLRLPVGTVTGFSVVARGPSGRILRVTVEGDAGSATISGNTLQSRLGLKDDRMWIDEDLLVTGEIRTKYDALDCALGLPTAPDAAIAEGVQQPFAGGAIFQGSGLAPGALWGPVLDFYARKGGPEGRLGFPVTDVRTRRNGVTRALFSSGNRIVCSADGSSCRIV